MKKKKAVKIVLFIVFIAVVILAIYNTYKWIVTGNQVIKINTSNKAYSNSELFVSVAAQKDGMTLETKSKIKLLDADGKKVKDTEVSYDGNNATIRIPEVEAGNYYIEAKVSTEEGKDTVEKSIYISDGNEENVTITFDKGIYKPGDTVNFRALLTNKDDDEPAVKDVNVSIYDGNDNKVYNQNVKTSDYGILSGTFKLADEVNSGIYKLIVKTNTNETTKEFKVNPYVTPKYEVKIDFDKDDYLVGEIAQIDLNAKYFFGEPAANTVFTVYIDDEKYQTIKADDNGNASINYKVEKAKTYSVKVEAVDSSNYYVEETASFSAGTDIFEIELLPEYGELVKDRKNDVFVFTKNPDGTPLKTYVTVSSENFTKQVATDENGVGKFSIDISGASVENYSSAIRSEYDDVEIYNESTNSNTINFSIIAENMDKEQVRKNIQLPVVSKSLLATTDKVKYQQGEDIKVNISSVAVGTKNIYFFKNDRLIKMINTDSTDTTVNLGDEYGLIDIYVTQKENISKAYKRTIFIKPTKALNININTDKEEYKPGDNIKISFGTTDENNNSVDSALLVSMLDNSILNLADNDLSIDNIKLALSNIKFSEDVDAATLYSCIVDDNSEQTLMALLLKQDDKDINISETTANNYKEERIAAIISVLSIIVIIVFVITYFAIRFTKFRTFLKHVANVLIYTFAITIFSLCILDEFFGIYDLGLFGLLIIVAISLITYITLVSTISKKLYKTSISILLTYLIFNIFLIIAELSEKVFFIALLVFLVLILILVILLKINTKKKLKISKALDKITIVSVYISKYIGAVLIATICGVLIERITKIDVISVPSIILFIYFFNYLFNKPKETGESTKEKDIKVSDKAKNNVIIIFAIIGVIVVIYIVYKLLTSTLDGMSSSNPRWNVDDVISSDFSSSSADSTHGSSGIDASVVDTLMGGGTADTSSITSGGGLDIPSIFDGANDLFSSEKSNESTTTELGNNQENVKETVVDDNIRNVFLESMCFIPELVTNNGNASVDLQLSDNITTWTIQVVGNTKDGRVGYGMLDNVKVFKDFFVDFELPTNLIKEDEVSIPITVYNYTDSNLTVDLKIQEDSWFKLQEDNNIKVSVDAEGTKMVYIPIEILETGNHKFRVEATNNSLTDIVEKELTIEPKGYKVEKVISTGVLDEDISEDILVLEDIVENTASAKVKIYASSIAQNIEGMENIFRMPTGCFEQVSSSLYPNILALKYLNENEIVNDDIRNKALNYISSGYQKLLTYEVRGEKGGYSLYGRSPAETVLTAYGLMELTDLRDVYEVDENVINNMTDFLYKNQNMNGSFNITGSHIGGASSRDDLALNAYIIWALSESNPNNDKLSKSIDYLKDNLDKVDDNYTLALIANALANVEDKEVDKVIERLVSNITVNGDIAYITSSIKDYYGTRGDYQTVQTVALTSMALSKTSKNQDTNKLLINYLLSRKDYRGTWHSTQATILALKAINDANENSKLDNQTITVRVNSEEQKVEIKDNPLGYYELTFNNLSKENKLNIDVENGSAYYEVVEEYYIPYDKVNKNEDAIEITVTPSSNNLRVNDILEANVKLVNKSENNIDNGMITILIPQGFTVVEESLMKLEDEGKIEKYEMNYSTINLYIRDFEISELIDLNIQFRASYPVDITGLAIRAYDYYNPGAEGKSMPIEIKVND